MKGLGICMMIWGMLVGCSGNEGNFERFDLSGYAVTASVASVTAISRVADKNNQTIFQKDDPILIDLLAAGGATAAYQYLYTGENGVFVPATGEGNRGLWSKLAESGNSSKVYAWYGKSVGNKLPVAGDIVTVTVDQRKEVDYLANIYMAACTPVADPLACKELHFDFKHLMACLKIHIRIDDMGVTPSDMMGTSATIADMKNSGALALDASGEYCLNVQNDVADVRMCQGGWDEQEPYQVEFKCLLPPQTLPKGQKIVVTLANGKKYACTLSDDQTVLAVGKETSLKIEIVAKGETVFKPQTTVFTNAPGGDFSGNRILSTIKDAATETYSYRVFDRRPDGSWGNGELLYEDESGTIPFPTGTYSAFSGSGAGVRIYGDYAVLAFGGMGTDAPKTFFFKKSKITGKWYCAKGKFGFCGYGIAISNDFLATGNHVGAANGYNTYIYPIDEEGNLGNGYIVRGMSGYKLSMSGNILATNNGFFVYNEGSQEWELKKSWASSTSRVDTDGQRVILQNGSGESNVEIYTVDMAGSVVLETWEGNPARAGEGKPVGIYGNYALAGSQKGWLYICYRNPTTGKWKNLGSFLDLLKRWNPDEFIGVQKLYGDNIVLKGTRALIASEGKIYFVENIDKMVEEWLASLPG